MTTREQVKPKENVTKTSRRSRDYNLPPLTFEEAARVLGVSVGELKAWVMETLDPSKEQWSLWTSGARELPEVVVRLFIMGRGALVEPTARYSTEEFQRLMAERARRRSQREKKVAAPAVGVPEKKRAAGGRR